jgi:hypothetical protein
MIEVYSCTIKDIPSNYMVSRKKRYTSMNLFYANTHWSVRKGIVDKAKATLDEHIDKKDFKIKPKGKLLVMYTYTSKKISFDVENRLGFWSKVFLDYAKGTNLIKDDNVKYIASVSYVSKYHKILQDELKITIYDLPS